MQTTHLPAHEDVDEGVVGCARFGKEGRNNGRRRRDHALSAEGLQHRHDSVRRPTDQEAGDHQEEHHGHFLFVTKNLNDLNRLQVLDGAQLRTHRKRMVINYRRNTPVWAEVPFVS